MGLAGFICRPNQQASAVTLDRIGKELEEGPALRLSPAFNDGNVCCVSSSLSFYDAKPYISADLAVWLDGEIYELNELDHDLAASESAASIFAVLYRRYGLAFLKLIDGIFAAVIYDRTRMEVHLVTDRYGLGRLYIWEGRALVW